MATVNSLIFLVNTLSKGEKRYFKLNADMQTGAKDYLCLFELIQPGLSGQSLKRAFTTMRPQASFATTVKYLYKVITDCLVYMRGEKDITSRQLMTLNKVNILFERSMYDEAFKQLHRIQAIAEIHEQYLIQLWAAKMELNYLCHLNLPSVTETALIQKQMKVQELLKYARNLHQHDSIYETLRHRLVHQGNIRTEKQKEGLNDLLLTELSIMAGPLSESFNNQKTHLLFQASYFMAVSDYKSALKTFYELNGLFEENEYLWKDSPLGYLSALEGILDSLRTIQHYEEMPFFLDKLNLLKSHSINFDLSVQRTIFIYKVTAMVDRGLFEQAIELKKEYEDILFNKMHLLDLSKQAEVFLYTAIIYTGAADITRAHYFLNRILLESKTYVDLPVYRTFRLMHLLLHFELGNDEYITSEIRSIKRDLAARNDRSYLLEEVIFKFLRLRRNDREKQEVWEKFQYKFKQVSENKYDIQMLKIFDFKSWIEASLLKRSFAVLLKEKISSFQQAVS